MKDLERDFKSLAEHEPYAPITVAEGYMVTELSHDVFLVTSTEHTVDLDKDPTDKELETMVEAYERKQRDYEYSISPTGAFFHGFTPTYHYKKGND